MKMHFYRFRRRLRHASGAIFALSLLLFVLGLLYIAFSSYPNANESNPRHKSQASTQHQSQHGQTGQQNNAAKQAQSEREQFLRNASWTFQPRPAAPVEEAGSVLPGEVANAAGDPEKALESILFLNAHHTVLNIDRFGMLTADSVDHVLLVQVHDRAEYLAYLIGSLSRARGIHRALVVFSHDLLNDGPINQLVQSITFCRVVQLFFPYNVQLFPNTFPGKGPRDCPEGVDKAKATELKCVDAAKPDVGGHYRQPKFTQIKHHWWWKVNYLFDGILPQYGLNEKLVLLLEEDHLVAPDFLHTLARMEAKRAKVCPDCELLCLGSYPKTFAHYGDELAKLGVEIWYSSKYNMGMALGKRLWENIRSANCSQFFCAYDDYNWDWTLMQLSVKCLPNKMRVIYTKAPRVIHIGDCGVHTHRCQADNAVHDALKLFQRVNASFFPAELEIADIGKRMLKPSKPNGGWGDPRDHQLCLLNTHPLEGPAGEVLAKARGALDEEGEKTTKMGREEA